MVAVETVLLVVEVGGVKVRVGVAVGAGGGGAVGVVGAVDIRAGGQVVCLSNVGLLCSDQILTLLS